MAQLSDRNAIRAFLNRDRPWAAYALGDLAPPLFERCIWFVHEEAMTLLYLGFDIVVMVGLGDEAAWSAVWPEVHSFLGRDREIYVSVRPAMMEHLAKIHTVKDAKPMLRMLLDPEAFRVACPIETAPAIRLGSANAEEVSRLYATGADAGEVPDFYLPEMLDGGIYYGVRADDDLIAVAGTHLVSAEESVAALGNIFTRCDRREQGWGTITTAAVTRQAVGDGYRTIILNVRESNHSARHIYRKLGYRDYCPYFEAIVRV